MAIGFYSRSGFSRPGATWRRSSGLATYSSDAHQEKRGFKLFDNFSLSTIFRLALMALMASASMGCSFSASSGSISDSISGSSDSIRSSSESSSESSQSGGGDERDETEEPESKLDAETYAKDVTQLAFTYAKQGGDIGALRSSVSDLAAKRGLTNWEVDESTCQNIGKGVGQAGMSEEDFTGFSDDLFGDDLAKASDLREGYEAGQPDSPETPPGS
jgi:hypothetical protein